MRENCQVYSDDIFLSTAASSLLNEIYTKNSELISKQCNILIINNSSLLNLPNIFEKLNKRKRYVVISSLFINSLLRGVEQLKLEKFIDIDISVDSIKYQLLMYLKGITVDTSVLTSTDKVILSHREIFVLKYLSMGMTPSFIARLSGVSVKTISSQKRSIMKKLCISNNQQLFIKSKLIKLAEERNSSPPAVGAKTLLQRCCFQLS